MLELLAIELAFTFTKGIIVKVRHFQADQRAAYSAFENAENKERMYDQIKQGNLALSFIS